MLGKVAAKAFSLPRLIVNCMSELRVCCVQSRNCMVDQSSLLGKSVFLLRYKICS